MSIDIEKLKAINAAAAQGEWIYGEPSDAVISKIAIEKNADSASYYGGYLVCESAGAADRRYIAAFNPRVTAELIAMIEELRSRQ